MKGITPRILSFLLALTLLASSFAVVAGPTREAEAATNNTFDAISPGGSRSFATAAGDNFPLYIGASPTYATDKTIYAVVSKNGSTNYQLVNARILRSTDGGKSWTAGLDPLTSLTGTATDLVRGLAVASNGTLVLLVTNAAAAGLLFRSTDGGSSFTAHSVTGAGAQTPTAATVPAQGAAGGDPAGLAVSPTFSSNGQVLVA
ncbi:MAG: exo-alpha-sialidase, partial [Chloroflexi bacterium]|nr:exo-alpha-sialidase [Chloroflexota bacterium]